MDTPIFLFTPATMLSPGVLTSGASPVGVPVRLLVVLQLDGDVEDSERKKSGSVVRWQNMELCLYH